MGVTMTFRQMKDSVNWAAIPVGTPLVGGYVPPSRFAWPPAAWARFAASIGVRITPSAATYGRGIHVLDQENGDATPGQVPGWVLGSRGAGQEPTVYTTYGTWAACIQACINAGVPVPQWWIADWNDQQNLPSITVNGVTYTAVAHQYADPNTSGGDYDLSVVADYWPGVDGEDMPLTNADAQLVVQELLNWYITTPSMPAGTAGRQVWDVLGDGERVKAAVAGVSSALSAEETAVLAAVQGVQGGAPTDAQMAALTAALTAALPSYTVSIAPKTS